MKGKVAFVLGAALGYVLGARAGRARYEQIKRGANAVWETPLVQQGVTALKGSVSNGVDNVKSAAARAAKGAFDSAMQARGAGSGTRTKAEGAGAAASDSNENEGATA